MKVDADLVYCYGKFKQSAHFFISIFLEENLLPVYIRCILIQAFH